MPNRISIFVFALLITAPLLLKATDSVTPTPSPVTVQAQVIPGMQKYSFSMYLLIKAKNKKNIPLPKFGYRILKTFPLSVREFTMPSKYIDYSGKSVKEKAESIVSQLSDNRKKNARYVAQTVFDYLKDIKDRIFDLKTGTNPHKLFLTAGEVLNGQEACILEKCRAAVMLLRYFTIPSVITMWRDHYAVEYYLRPLDTDGKGRWYVMDFTGGYNENDAFIEPAEWMPLNSRELLNEDWDGSDIYINASSVKNSYFDNMEEAISEYNKITLTAEDFAQQDKRENTQSKKPYYLIKGINYEIYMNEGSKADIKFTLPFNTIDFFKTMKFYLKSNDNNLVIKYKRPRSYVIPPQEGMVFMLPAGFVSQASAAPKETK